MKTPARVKYPTLTSPCKPPRMSNMKYPMPVSMQTQGFVSRARSLAGCTLRAPTTTECHGWQIPKGFGARWCIHPQVGEKFADSLAKLFEILKMCDVLGIDTCPAEVARGVYVVPLYSW